MKRRFIKIAILVSSLFTGLHSSAQLYEEPAHLFKGILSVGFNAAQIDGDAVYGFKHLGLNAGAGTMVNVSKMFAFSLEIMYTQRGAKVKYNFSKYSGIESFKTNTDYIEVPLCFNYIDKRAIIATIGVSAATLAHFSLQYQGYDRLGNPINTPVPDCLAAQPNQIDVSGIAGIQLLIKERIAIGGRYSYSLTSMKPPCPGTTESGQYHNVITFRASYIVGGKKTE
jgi:Outer membrane protein beta-barrel domain